MVQARGTHVIGFEKRDHSLRNVNSQYEGTVVQTYYCCHQECPKWAIWRVYRDAAEGETTHPVAYTTFCYLWRTLVPSALVMKPRSDLCWQCQQNSAAIVCTANSPTHLRPKSASIASALEYLCIVKEERAYYESTGEECKKSTHATFFTNGEFTPPPPSSCMPCNSRDIISFKKTRVSCQRSCQRKKQRSADGTNFLVKPPSPG